VVATLVGVITVAGVTIAEAPAAGAAAGCTTSTPALSVLDTCTSAGTQTITVPNGAATVNLSVIGAGGGGSDFNVFPAGGGSGADLSGLAALPTGTTAIQVVVGAGGSPGTGTNGGGGTGGHGGGGSAIFAYDGGTLLGAIAIAGAGGGSGGMDLGDPGFNLYGPGGNAGAAGGIGGISGSFMANGGGAATAATGGTGGNAGGTAGGDASAGTVATGGAGAVLSSHQRGGGGGGGYAGGGGGGALAEGSDDQFAGGGGGGGSSYNDPTNFPSPSSSIASNGGSSCASYIPIQFCAPTAGGTGSVSVTFGGAVPVVGPISPTSGPTGGGGTLTLHGVDLTGTTGVTVGGNACTSVSVVSDTEVTCTLPAGTAGSADVVLTTPGGSATDSGAYTYVAAPTITSVSPTAGPLDGGLLTINGTNLAGATAITVGGSTCSPVTMPSATQIICTLPAHAAGTVDVSVTTPGGSVTDSGAYTYQALPTITSVAPSAGPLIGGSTLTITGTDLTNASAVTVGGNACTPYTVVSATEITCLLPAGTAGSADVAVTTPGGSATDPAAYDYLPIPTITSVSPAAGPLSGGGTLTIIGTGFTGANALTVGGNGCTPYTVVSDTEVTCVLPAGTAGSADVSVGTPGGSATDPGAYQYLAAPTVTSISPSAGPAKGGNAVTITGDGFTPDSAVTIGGSACTSVTVVSTTELTCVVPAGVVGTVDVSVTTPGGTATLAGAYQYQAPSGYWLVGADGGVFSFGTQFYGSTGNLTLNAPVFAMTSTSDGKGYWFVARDGGVFSYGDAQFHGSLPQMGEHVDDITGMTVDPATGGYWLVGANGGVYAFDAPFAGSLPGRGIQAADIVGIASTPTGLGYYLVGSNGAVYPFGDARAQGEASTMPFINAPIVGISVDSATGGYWEVGADGGVYSYGAPFHGSMAGTALNRPIVGMSATPDGSGYYLVGGDGGVFAFNAPFLGSLAGKPLRAPIVGTTTAGAV
jgi:hypothetical protein